MVGSQERVGHVSLTSTPARSNMILALARRLAIGTSGAAIIEFAVTLPVLVLMLFGTFEFGRLLWIQNALHYSVQQAARCGSFNATLCGNGSAVTASQTQSYAAGIAGAGIPSSVFTVNFSTACGTVTGTKVSAAYTVRLFIPYFSLSPTLSASSCFPN